MRSIAGQQSDRVARKRTPEEKKKQLAALKGRLAVMKSHESPTLRASVEKSIAELEKELAGR
jgi:hypothetical protein